MVGPIIDELSADYEGKAVVAKIDVDTNQIFAAKYGVRNIPTVLIFNNGELVDRQVGVAPKKTYSDALDSSLKKYFNIILRVKKRCIFVLIINRSGSSVG